MVPARKTTVPVCSDSADSFLIAPVEKVRFPVTRTSGRSRVLSGATSVLPLALTGAAAAGATAATGSATAALSVEASALSGPPAPQAVSPASANAAAVAATAVLVVVRRSTWELLGVGQRRGCRTRRYQRGAAAKSN